MESDNDVNQTSSERFNDLIVLLAHIQASDTEPRMGKIDARPVRKLYVLMSILKGIHKATGEFLQTYLRVEFVDLQ